MARLARVVMSGVAHHVTQRGNRRQRVFFSEKDYREYVKLMSEWCGKCSVKVLAYCLMPNHVHLIVEPRDADGLARAVGEAHRRYTRHINFSKGWRGYLWQGRFASFPMSPLHLRMAVKYVELNPVRAKMCKEAWDYRWSSARAHVMGKDDDLVSVGPMLRIVKNWRRYLGEGTAMEDRDAMLKHERTGRPMGDTRFIARLEEKLARPIRKQKPGPKPPPN